MSPGNSIKWLKPPAFDDVAVATTAALLHWVTLIVGVLTLLVTAMTLVIYQGDTRQIIGNIAALFLVAGTQILLRRGHVTIAAHLFIAVLWCIVTAIFFLRGGMASGLATAYFASIATTAVLTSRKAGVWVALASSLAVGVMYFSEAHGYQPVSYFTPLTSFVVVVSSLMMSGGVTYFGARLREAQMASVKASDQARHQSESRYAELVRTAPDGIMVVDADGIILSANPAAARIFGAPTDTLIGQPLSSLPGFAEISDQPAVQEAVVERADGTVRSVEVEAGQLPIGTDVGLRVSVRDVTLRRTAERERDRATAQLQQSQKLESIGMLAGGVAHDFNNLITVLFANVELMRDRISEDAAAAESLDEIESASKHASELTRQLLAFSRRQVLAPKDISINTVVEGLGKLLRRLLPENIELRTELQSKGIVRADPGQLEQVLLNLAANARDAMPDGGTLLLRTTDVDIAAALDLPPRPHTCLRVIDTGAGMPPEIAARAFEPFFTTKGPGAGTGLGLAVVEGIVQQSGGTIVVDSTPEGGTAFEIRFPQIRGATGAVSLPRPPPASHDAASGTILLIEDEEQVRDVIARLLQRAGYTVLRATDGIDALAVAGAHTGDIDLVVTDHIMPRMSGPDAVAELRKVRRGLRALFISGYTGGAMDDVGTLGIGTRFLQKPFETDVLLAITRSLIAEAPTPL